MAASPGGFTAQLNFKLGRRPGGYAMRNQLGLDLEVRKRRRLRVEASTDRIGTSRISCCCSDSVVPIRRSSGSGKSIEKSEDWRFDPKKSSHSHRVRLHASPALPFASPQYSLSLSLICIYTLKLTHTYIYLSVNVELFNSLLWNWISHFFFSSSKSRG